MTPTPEAIAYEEGTVSIEQSGWATGAGALPDYPVLEEDRAADVVVVGAGLAGCSLALHLAEAGVNVVVLEARQPGWGASGRNAGHVLPTLKDLQVIRQFPDGGKGFLELFKAHHTIPFDLARKYDIDCDAAQTGYLNAMSRKSVFERFQKKSRFWQQEQGQQVEFLGASDMKKATGSDYYPYGVLYQSGGRVNPYRLSNGLASAAVKYGASIFGESEALTLKKAANQWSVSTESGSVTADRVVFCTNAYPTDIVPAFANSFYPLTAYTLCTRPLPESAANIIMPSRSTLAQVPIDLHPFIIDESNRIFVSSIPRTSRADNAAVHFNSHLAWIRRTWPEVRGINIEIEHYWTGKVALREREFPGVFEWDKGVYGLMHFNAWGNVMAPLLSKMMAASLAQDRIDLLPFPLEKPQAVANPNKQKTIIRKMLLPAARLGQKIGIL